MKLTILAWGLSASKHSEWWQLGGCWRLGLWVVVCGMALSWHHHDAQMMVQTPEGLE